MASVFSMYSHRERMFQSGNMICLNDHDGGIIWERDENVYHDEWSNQKYK